MNQRGQPLSHDVVLTLYKAPRNRWPSNGPLPPNSLTTVPFFKRRLTFVFASIRSLPSRLDLSAISSAALIAKAAAHGYVNTGVIGGTEYTFYQPYQDPYTSPAPERISRAIQGNGPVTDVESIDVQCGGYSEGGVVGSSPAALHAPATAGSTVTLNWTLWPESHFGAFVTYMAKCPDTGCNDWLPGEEAVWFKIDEAGLIDKASNSWAVDSIMTEPNSGYSYTIPSCIADGYYLVRHEIIAVFVANVYPGAQLYPGCHQLQVTGGGSTTPSDLVSFPGAYKPTDGGITWSSESDTYPIPGPSVFTCSGSGSGSGSGSAPIASSAASSAPATTATPIGTSTSAPAATSAATAVDEPAPSSAAPTTSTAAAAPTSSVPDTGSDEGSCNARRLRRRHPRALRH